MTFASGAKIYDDAAVLNLYRICWNAILFEARLTNPATSMEFPIVPGADDIIAVEPTLAKRGPPTWLQALETAPNFPSLRDTAMSLFIAVTRFSGFAVNSTT